MIVIKHIDGWSVSNIASVDSDKIPIRDDNGKIKGFSIAPYISVTSPYTVVGNLSGIVKCAIKDDVSGVVKCYEGIYHDGKVRNIKEIDKDFLVSLK